MLKGTMEVAVFYCRCILKKKKQFPFCCWLRVKFGGTHVSLTLVSGKEARREYNLKPDNVEFIACFLVAV